MAQPSTTKKKPRKGEGKTLMQAPPGGVRVRMYRQGHGDCFLIAFPNDGSRPFYVLIDCGYKPGSKVHRSIDDVVKDIEASTGGYIDVAVITHEHQDHVNGFWRKTTPRFTNMTFGESWWAWTEDDTDQLARELRRRHRDQLLSLMAISDRLGADEAERVRPLLETEFGVDEDTGTFAAAGDPANSINKQAMKYVRDRTRDEVRYLRPHTVRDLPATLGTRVYVLGPPHDADLIADEDPRPAEAFPAGDGSRRSAGSFGAAADSHRSGSRATQPFAARFAIPLDVLKASPPDVEADPISAEREFFRRHYGLESQPDPVSPRYSPASNPDFAPFVPDGVSWRRIDNDWLRTAEELALALNTGTNNTSLVLAFELKKSKKVLLFVGDAQRGNWVSWNDGDWLIDDKTVTAQDLLARTVLYKVGHHGSHNATLEGEPEAPYPNLSWMGQGPYADEFAAMITAVPDWALKQKPPWRHPLESIKTALRTKAAGRVFQTSEEAPAQPASVSDAKWKKFLARSNITDLYFEYDVLDQI